MPSPYPIELRLRAIHASDVYGLDRAARLFQVGTASLKRWRRRAMGGDRRGGAATAARLEAAINEKPDRILRELATWFLDTAGRVISISGLCRNLRVAGYRLRSKVTLAAERGSERWLKLRREYLAAVAGIDSSKLVFLDESGCQIGMQRPNAWRRAGTTVLSRSVRNRGTVTTILGAMSERGLIAVMYGEGATTGEVFLSYVATVLVPELRLGDVVVMDNLGAHKTVAVADAIKAAGASILLLPPYSPELNPIEHTWSKLKTIVRRLAPQCLTSLHAGIDQSVREIRAIDAQAWFAHCRYLPRLAA